MGLRTAVCECCDWNRERQTGATMKKLLIAAAAIVSVSVLGCQRPEVAIVRDLPAPVARPAAARPAQQSQRNHRLAGLTRSPGQARPTEHVTPEPGWIPPGGISSRWTCIVIHHSGSDYSTPQSMDRYHREVRGWDELGYHFVIGNGIGYPDGKVFVGPRWRKQKHGAHCKVPGNYYNEHGIGICLIGDFERHPPTEKQMQALARLCAFLMEKCHIPIDRIYTHGGITGKTRCPGRYFSMSDLLRRLDGYFYATTTR